MITFCFVLCIFYAMVTSSRAPLMRLACVGFRRKSFRRTQGGARFFRHAGARWPYSCYSHVKMQGIAGVGRCPMWAVEHARLVVTMAKGCGTLTCKHTRLVVTMA